MVMKCPNCGHRNEVAQEEAKCGWCGAKLAKGAVRERSPAAGSLPAGQAGTARAPRESGRAPRSRRSAVVRKTGKVFHLAFCFIMLAGFVAGAGYFYARHRQYQDRYAEPSSVPGGEAAPEEAPPEVPEEPAPLAEAGEETEEVEPAVAEPEAAATEAEEAEPTETVEAAGAPEVAVEEPPAGTEPEEEEPAEVEEATADVEEGEVTKGKVVSIELAFGAPTTLPRMGAGVSVPNRDTGTPSSRRGLYGEVSRSPARSIKSAVDKSVLRTRPWERKPFHYFHTALHPGMFMRAKSPDLRLFERTSLWGLGQPSFLVFKTKEGTASLSSGAFMGKDMVAPWFIASFAGSRGWEQWDAPWLVVLQKRPARVEKAEDCVRLLFRRRDTGYVLFMPLFGYYKPPQEGKDLLAQGGMPSSGIETWKWKEGLPEGVVKLCDFWAGTARAFPYTFEETFSVDRLLDTIVFRQKHSYLENKDDWGTRGVKFAMIPPTLGLAHIYGTFPMEFSHPVTDPHCMTAYGPVLGVVGADEFTYAMHVLQYVNETEKRKAPNTRDPIVAEALGILRKRMADYFREPAKAGPYDHGASNYCWSVMGDCWCPKVLAHVADKGVADRARASFRRYLQEKMLNPGTYRSFRHKLQLFGPGIGAWGGWDDSGKFATNSIHSIWCFGHYGNNWDLLKKAWPLILKLNITVEEMQWAMVGRAAIAELGDEAGPMMALARIAWKLGDVDQYNYACYAFAKELVHHYVKQLGGDYFRRHQPYHSTAFMPPEVFPTNMWGSTAGWQVDGIRWGVGEHQSTNRWVRFHQEDVGRFYRDVLAKEIKKELDDEITVDFFRRGRNHIDRDDSHILPSFVRVRSLLLNESPQELAKWARPSDIKGPGTGVIATMFGFIRTGTRPEYERLIPASGKPSPFVMGRERETTGSLNSMALADWGGSNSFPRIVWHFWPPPRQPSEKGLRTEKGRPFGFVNPFPGLKPANAKSWPLDWAGRVKGYDAAR